MQRFSLFVISQYNYEKEQIMYHVILHPVISYTECISEQIMIIAEIMNRVTNRQTE